MRDEIPELMDKVHGISWETERYLRSAGIRTVQHLKLSWNAGDKYQPRGDRDIQPEGFRKGWDTFIREVVGYIQFMKL